MPTASAIPAPGSSFRREASASPPTRLIRDTGLPDPFYPQAQEHPVEVAAPRCVGVPARQPLLRDGAAHGRGVAPVRPSRAGMADGCRPCATSRTRTSTSAITSRGRPRPPAEAYTERQGVCRDYAHLAITLLRCLNIPARYCTGYLGDIGVPVADAPMDFAGWLEAYIGGAWHTFDPAQQPAPHRPDIDRARTRRGGCRHQHGLRAQLSSGVPGLDRRGQFRNDGLEHRIAAEGAQLIAAPGAHPNV